LKLLFDENLSPRLVPALASLFSDAVHVNTVGLHQTEDTIIWRWAKDNRYTIVTADWDFAVIATRLGAPPKVIYISRCDFSRTETEWLLRTSAIRITGFLADSKNPLLILER
jgi:predicted nuclease of predicted toxin-antitoxin system